MLESREPIGTKEKILAAALDEFAEHGLAGARVDRIAGRASVNKAMIYYHFESKGALYDCIVKTHMEAGVNLLTDAIGQDMTLEQILTVIATYHHEAFQRAEKFSRIMLREFAAGSETITRALSELAGKEELRLLIVRMIEAGKREGRYRDIDIRHAMISFAGMSLFYLMVAPMADRAWGIADDSGFKKQRPGAIVDLFLHGLEAKLA
jgi:AcrR family transcriptional regulator